MDYSRLRSIAACQMIAALLTDGFQLCRQKGSHRHYRHPDGRRVTVSFHHSAGKFPIGTLKSMIETQAQWTAADIARFGL